MDRGQETMCKNELLTYLELLKIVALNANETETVKTIEHLQQILRE